MKIHTFDEKVLQEAAQSAFPESYVEITQADLYLKGKGAGRYRASWLDQDIYVSTEYAYVDEIENGNRTRVKLHIPCVLIKHDPYEVVYDSRDRFYSAYEKEGTVAFMKYVELIVKLGEDMEQMEVLTPVSQCSI